MHDPRQRRRDAEAIWRAGVAAVDSEKLVRAVIRRSGDALEICGETFPLPNLNRIAVVGAGKAGAGMASAFEQAVGPDVLAEKVTGWVNVPADCVRSLERIHLHAARPAGINEPTEAGVAGSTKILEIVSALDERDLCVVLISGGGSALLPAPVQEITLADKQAVTKFLMHAGATINELNCVRKQLSRIKGGGLARASRAGRLLTLIISDVIGDPLDVIASGPTVANPTTATDALDVLRKFDPSLQRVPSAVVDYLTATEKRTRTSGPLPETVSNHIIGNNALALSAAAEKAGELGYNVHLLGSTNSGEARTVGKQLAETALGVLDQSDPISAPACVLWGGESVVHLSETDRARRGGRNQEVALAALERLWEEDIEQITILSGGTDGEDGPTDAAGAVADSLVLEAARQQQLQPREFLAINDSNTFFENVDGLLKTGPTHTNVMDVAVTLVGR